MSDDQPPVPRSPFMMSPSARPPSAEEARVVVRVPPPPGVSAMPQDSFGTPMYGSVPPVQAYAPQPPMQQQQPFDQNMMHAPTMMAGPAMGALPAAEAKKKMSPIPIVAVVLAAAVLGAVFVFQKKPEPVPQDPPQENPQPTSATATTAAPTVAPTAPTVVPNVVPSATAAAAPKPFDAAAAKSAVEGADVASCKVPKGKSCKVKVSFAADGSVKHAEAVAPCLPTTPAVSKCLVSHAKKVTVAPFTGAASPVTASLPHK